MIEKPHPLILDRETTKKAVTEKLGPQMDMLHDLANYGSTLIVRAFNSSEADMAATIVCSVFLKQIVAMVDAVEVLMREGCGHACFLPARSAFEASLYLHYIIEADSERRATRYYVGNLRDRRRWAKKLIPGTAEAKAYSDIASSIGVDPSEPEDIQAIAMAEIEAVAKNLAQEGLKSVDEEFDAARKKSRHVDWYTLDGISTVRQLAKHLGRIAEYETFYSRGSNVMHVGKYQDHVKFVDGKMHMVPIRHIADLGDLMHMVMGITLGSYRRVIERYRSGEVAALSKKYIEDWRSAYRNVPEFRYNYGTL